MLILPAHRQIDWSNPPYTTITLIVINVLIFAVWQRADDGKIAAALAYYKQQETLIKLELPLFKKHLRQNNPDIFKQLRSTPQNTRDDWFIYYLIYDPIFNGRLKNGLVINRKNEAYDRWQQERREFEYLVDQLSTRKLGFIPADPRPITWLSNMFLHGSWNHLFGNMVFLLIFGFSLEAFLGTKGYLPLYLLSGLCATALHGLINWGSSTPAVGASGAISGLMGAYVALYGYRKIQFFYWVIFYFNYIRLPALIVLPIWIFKEFYESISNTQSNTAYFAHIGGLIGGAAIMWLAKSSAWIKRDAIDKDSKGITKDPLKNQHQLNNKAYEIAMQEIAELNFDSARKKLHSLIAKEPTNLSYLNSLLKIEKLTPNAPAYHGIVKKIISLPGSDPKHRALIYETFKQYEAAVKDSRLDKQHLIKVAKIAMALDRLSETEHIIKQLEKSTPNFPIIPEVLLLLAKHYKQRQQKEKYLEILLKLEKYYGDSEQGQRAKMILDKDYDKRDN